jgi:hydroxymethylpyrimidine pyrophosphatase-like HAD family hydrolase
VLATDLDGTLLGSKRTVSRADWDALVALGERGIVRVIATGRSLYSARKVLTSDLPIDYLVYSSGAGAITWPGEEPVFGHSMAADLAQVVDAELQRLGCDFMAQYPAPDTHKFSYVGCSGARNLDFDHRIELYQEHATARRGALGHAVSQFVVVSRQMGGVALFEELKQRLAQCNVVRTTSPLDDHSVWIEVFPANVSKAAGCAAIARKHMIEPAQTMGIGNDFNDLDMLDWVGSAFVVANGPAEMRGRYEVVASNDAGGLSQAIARWRP